jgi:hypothetical protein
LKLRLDHIGLVAEGIGQLDDIDAALRTLEAQGFTVVSPPVDCPAYDVNLGRECAGTTRIAFFLLSDKILIELIEKGR